MITFSVINDLTAVGALMTRQTILLVNGEPLGRERVNIDTMLGCFDSRVKNVGFNNQARVARSMVSANQC